MLGNLLHKSIQEDIHILDDFFKQEKNPMVLLKYLQMELVGSIGSMTWDLNSLNEEVTKEQEYTHLRLMELQGKIQSRNQNVNPAGQACW